MPHHLECQATVIYDLSLITTDVSKCHLFSDITISQGTVATRLTCGGICSYHFARNSSPSLAVKEFWKSIKIWQSYRHEFGGPVFFLEHSVVLPCGLIIPYTTVWNDVQKKSRQLLCLRFTCFNSQLLSHLTLFIVNGQRHRIAGQLRIATNFVVDVL